MQVTFYYVTLNGLSFFYVMRLAKMVVEEPPAHLPTDPSCPTCWEFPITCGRGLIEPWALSTGTHRYSHRLSHSGSMGVERSNLKTQRMQPPHAIACKSSSLPIFCLISILCRDIIWKIQNYKLFGAEVCLYSPAAPSWVLYLFSY